jgi:hypothetical protein
MSDCALTGALLHCVQFHSVYFTMQINHIDSTEHTSGIVTDDALGTALLATGAVIGAGWTLGSHIHTLVAAPLTSITAVGGSAALAGAGAYRLTKDTRIAANKTVDTTATAAA